MTLPKDASAKEYADAFPRVVLSWLGAYVIFSVGIVHFLQSDELVKAGATPYALLFLLNFALCCISAFFTASAGPRLRWPWAIGVAVCGASLVAFLISRTLGLPGLPTSEESWFTLPGAIALPLEIAFIAVAGAFLTSAGGRIVQFEQRLLEEEPTPQRLTEIENEMSDLRDEMSPDARDVLLRANAGSLSGAARNRAARLAHEKRDTLRRFGFTGAALVFLAAILRGRRR